MNPKFFRNGIVMLVLVVGTAALLFTWISTTSTADPDRLLASSSPTSSAGKVDTVVQQGDDARRSTLDAAGTDLHRHRPEHPDRRLRRHAGAPPRTAARTLGRASSRPTPAPDTSWLGLLLTAVLPLLVIGGFIFFMMRQAQGTNNQALSLRQEPRPDVPRQQDRRHVRRRRRRRRGQDRSSRKSSSS